MTFSEGVADWPVRYKLARAGAHYAARIPTYKSG
jgi:hypothetical protein